MVPDEYIYVKRYQHKRTLRGCIHNISVDGDGTRGGIAGRLEPTINILIARHYRPTSLNTFVSFPFCFDEPNFAACRIHTWTGGRCQQTDTESPRPTNDYIHNNRATRMAGSCWALVSAVKLAKSSGGCVSCNHYLYCACDKGSEKSVGVIVRIILELQYGTWCICVGYDLRQNEDRRTKNDRGRQRPPAVF